MKLLSKIEVLAAMGAESLPDLKDPSKGPPIPPFYSRSGMSVISMEEIEKWLRLYYNEATADRVTEKLGRIATSSDLTVH